MLSPIYLLVVFTLPWAISLFSSLLAYTRNPDMKVERSFWHGPMGRWEAICTLGISWFMFRWYLARNMLTAFAIICILASVILTIG